MLWRPQASITATGAVRCHSYFKAFRTVVKPHLEFGLVADFAVLPSVVGHTINDEEFRVLIKYDEWVMPCATRVVHALGALGDKGAQPVQIGCMPARCDDDDPSRRAERNEGLATPDVAFQASQPQWRRLRLGTDEAYRGVPAARRHVDLSEIVNALSRAAIYRLRWLPSAKVDDVAERAKRR